MAKKKKTDNYKKRLRESFKKACKKFPDLKDVTKPIGEGGFGLVVEHEDGKTLTKILHRPSKRWEEYGIRSFENEIIALRILTDHPIKGVLTPAMIGKPEKTQGNKKYLGRYSMTRITGTHAIVYGKQTKTKNKMEKAFLKSVGRKLAIFHREAAKTPLADIKRDHAYDGRKIRQIKTIPDEINKALKKADKYLQAHKVSGVVHGDLHNGNILFDRKGNVSAFLDFANTGFSGNILVDFMNITYMHQKNAGHFINAYEKESGLKIDRHMITATALSMNTTYLHFLNNFDGKKSDKDYKERKKQCEKEKVRITGEIEKNLSKMSKITGYQIT